MDPDWDEVVQIPLPPPGMRAHPTPVTALAFDTCQELLWAGNEYGRVSSFYGTELQPYTSFKAHRSQDGKVYQLLFHEKGVIALGPRSVHMAMRRGPPLWTIRHEDMDQLRCMTFTSKGTNEILVAGEQDKMLVIDVNKGEVIKILPTDHQYKFLRRSRYICAATTRSAVNILDATTFKIIKTWNAHAFTIHDMDAQHDFIVTCGLSPRQSGIPFFDPLVHAFDLKNMTSMPPVPFPAGAAHVRMHPRMSTTSIVVSQVGQMHVVDLMNPNTSSIRQASTLTLMNMIDIAPSGEALALADNVHGIHLWGSPSKIRFSELPIPVEFASPEHPVAPLDWDNNTPLNSVGMPYYREMLLSAWPKDLISEVGAPPMKDDPVFISTLQRREWGLYGKNSRGLRRNQVEDTRGRDQEQNTLRVPKFLSEKARESRRSRPTTPVVVEDIITGPTGALRIKELDSHKAAVPEMYHSHEIQYSKFGIDDFDFRFFNETQYAGLQNHIANSYTNSLLQIMFFTPVIRNLALHHAASSCIDESCLLCELGFLFDMLYKAEGTPCHASNLLKTFSYHPQAANLGLLENRPHNAARSVMLQNFSRFLLEKMVQDHRRMGDHCGVDELFETAATSLIRCNNCGSETSRPAASYVHELTYTPNMKVPRHAKAPKVTFSQVLKKSVERDMNTKGWCQTCHKYQTLSTRRLIARIPAVLTIAAGMPNDEHRRMWAMPGWLPDEIGIIVSNGQFFCYEGEDLRLHLQRGFHEIRVYSLTGLAASIEIGQSKGTHLVAMANVAHSAERATGEDRWHLFNDFHVKPIVQEEALAFNTTWKTPTIFTYQVKDANNSLDGSWKDRLDDSLLYYGHGLVPATGDKTYQSLDPAKERLGAGSIIAIDTEFVSTSKAEIEIMSDGSSRTIRPTVHALARISVLRGNGVNEGVPFIDDYVYIRESVIDYLTAYSGITAEDLDPKRTRHTLVTLKMAYKKMWILLNLGCKFLGHGLNQDFRVINIHVPRSQIIDTSDLFLLQNRVRKLSLQFLAWCLLKEDIQQKTHDSIEDSRTALKLYRKYEEFVDAGILNTMLSDIYQKGSAMSYRPPAKTPSADLAAPSAPARLNGAAPSTSVKIRHMWGLGSSSSSSPGWRSRDRTVLQSWDEMKEKSAVQGWKR